MRGDSIEGNLQGRDTRGAIHTMNFVLVIGQ